MGPIPLIPVILCGGTGTRLWPLSRASYPKQYWPLSGEGDATLLQQTQQRLIGLDALAAPVLICNEDHRFIVAEQMRQIGVEPNAILLEPMGRNTAPAVTVAALQATANGDDPLLLVLAAGQRLGVVPQFSQAIDAGRPPAAAGRLVTFGIVPTVPKPVMATSRPANPSAWTAQRMCRLSVLWKNPIRPRLSSFWPPAASPGTAACSCSAQAPCWRSWSSWSPKW